MAVPIDRPLPPTDPDDAPLAQTLAASRAHFGGHDVLATRVHAPEGWLPAAEVIRAGPLLDELLARATQATGTQRADIGGTLLAEGYAWALALRAVGTLLFGTRIPALAPDEVSLELAAGDTTITGVALSGGSYGIAGDARAGDPSLVVLADEDALLTRLHVELETHLAPLLEAIGAATGRPRRALWRSAGDRLGGAFLWLGEVVGARERAWELGTRCMHGSGPLAVGAGFRVLEHAGIAEPTRNRRSCCLIWRADGNDTCFTCPLTSDVERRARLQARAAAAA
ncbi:MAG: (2Fe-2S)-binding protein [Solirubrobacteraceae bacterium]|nr:(2Fe-2S)-binding protein [Solirubrobacteraceae bacterium]